MTKSNMSGKAPATKIAPAEGKLGPGPSDRPALPPISSLTDDPMRPSGREGIWAGPHPYASSSHGHDNGPGGRAMPPYSDSRGWHARHASMASFSGAPPEQSKMDLTEGGSPRASKLPPLASSRSESSQLGKRAMVSPGNDADYRSSHRPVGGSPTRPSAGPWSHSRLPLDEPPYSERAPLRRANDKCGAPQPPPSGEERYWTRSAEGSPSRRLPGPPLARDESFGEPRGAPAFHNRFADHAEGSRARPGADDEPLASRDRTGPWREYDGLPGQGPQGRYGPTYGQEFRHLVKPEGPDEDVRRRGPGSGYTDAPPPPGHGYPGLASRSPPYDSPRHMHPGHPPPPGYALGRDPTMPPGVPMAVPPPVARPASTVGVMMVPGGASVGSTPASTAAAAATPSANRRVAHLLSEQRRRESINTGFEDLRQALPACRDGQDSKATVLRRAVEYIHELESILHQSQRMRNNSGGVDFDSRSPPHDPYGRQRHPGRPDSDPRGNSGDRGGASRRGTGSSSHSDDRTVINGIPGHSFRRDGSGYGAQPPSVGRSSQTGPSPPGSATLPPPGASSFGNQWTGSDYARAAGHYAPPNGDDAEAQHGLKRSNSDPSETDVARVRRKLSDSDSSPPHQPSPRFAGSVKTPPIQPSRGPRPSDYRLQREGDPRPTAVIETDAIAGGHGAVRLRSGLGPDDMVDPSAASAQSAVPRRASNSIYIERHA